MTFPGSASYWEARYRTGGTSGAGSYGPLAEFKAAILNEFVRNERVHRVIEIGCGDGAQLALTRYPEYVGVDVSPTAIEQCTARFVHDGNKRFYLYDALPNDLGRFDLALSLDVIYHLVEDFIFDSYMRL
ncbi:MAG: class I SAM-dependent methyltransferase, partial [Vulcanimicrobiaceae bacterium]